MTRSWISLLAGFLCFRVLACPPDSSLDELLEHRTLVLGEIHGTVETPAFFRCLVERALLSTREPLTVSLELESAARDLTSDFWATQDGRASHAMWLLLQFLQEQQRAGKLSLHLQLEKPDFYSFEEAKAYTDNWEQNRGIAIKELAERGGRVIALMGNAHASRDPLKFDGAPVEGFKMAGYFMGSDVTRVRVETVDGGEAWTCRGMPPAITCGPSKGSAPKIPGASPDQIVSGDALGYDLIYFLPERAYSASAPHLHTNEPEGSNSSRKSSQGREQQ